MTTQAMLDADADAALEALNALGVALAALGLSSAINSESGEDWLFVSLPGGILSIDATEADAFGVAFYQGNSWESGEVEWALYLRESLPRDITAATARIGQLAKELESWQCGSVSQGVNHPPDPNRWLGPRHSANRAAAREAVGLPPGESDAPAPPGGSHQGCSPNSGDK